MTKKLNIFIQYILYNISIPVKCILWQIFKRIVENQDFKFICKMYKFNNDLQLKIVVNQDLYRNKEEFRFNKKKKIMSRGGQYCLLDLWEALQQKLE